MKNRQLISVDIITVWYNTYGCAEKYIYATALYLLEILAHEYNIIINCGVGEPVPVRDVAGGLNLTYKHFLSVLTKMVQLPSAAGYDSQVTMQTSTVN